MTATFFPSPFLVPRCLISGKGTIAGLIPHGRSFGARCLLIHGKSIRLNGTLDALQQTLPGDVNLTTWEHPGGEPTIDELEDVLHVARSFRCNWIAGIGGGSTMDLAKACAGLYECRHPVSAYYDGRIIESPPLPFALCPTTAGTGAEATCNAVLANPGASLKKSIRDNRWIANMVFLDPELLQSCPPSIIAGSGMDALTQAVEAYTSRHATPWTDILALESIRLIAENLEDLHARFSIEKAMSLLTGSYLAGMALTYARLGVVHGLAHPLGIRYHLPHGIVCAVCLPLALEFNRSVIESKYDNLCRLVNMDFIVRIRQLLRALDIQSPFLGRRLSGAEEMIAETLASGSTKANPRPVEPRDVEWLLGQLFSERNIL